MLTFESSIIWLKKNNEISWKSMQQLNKPQCTFLSNMQQVTSQNNLDTICMSFKTADFDSK